MGFLVNTALGALAGVLGSLLGALVLGSKFALPLGIAAGLVGYFAGGAIAPPKQVDARDLGAEWEEEEKAKKAKRARKAAAEARRKEELAEQRAAEAEQKAAAKRAKRAAKKAAKAAAESDSESDEEEEQIVITKDMSKSAIKKAKLKMKELAAKKEAEAAAKAAAKKAKKEAKKGGAAAAQAAASVPKSGVAAASTAASAFDLDGEWETIEPTKPTKAQVARSQQPSTKQAHVPPSERPLTEDVIVPIKQHALIIGAKGATLQMLTEGSGANIDMPKRESGSAKIQITGTPAQVAVAKNAILSLVERGFSNLTHPGVLSDDINVEPRDIGLILGANGSNVRAIQSKTGTKINLPEKGSSSKKVLIVGEKDGVKEAKAALRQLLADGFSPLTHEGWVKTEIDFPAEKIGLLVGPKGQTIKSVQGNTKTRINLPDKSGSKDSSRVVVCGLPAGVAQAEKEILRLLEPPAPLPEPEEEDLATDDAWGQEHTAQGEDALW